MKILRHILLMLLLSLLIGFMIGTIIRMRLAGPEFYMSAVDERSGAGSTGDGAAQPELRPLHSTSGTPARAFSSRASTKSRSDSRLT